jgi:DNA-binding transcriptional LysR family regulator
LWQVFDTIEGMDLTQRALEQFVVVAQEGHIGRAAQRLSMTQPPLTKAIHRLERALRVRLFDRTPRGVELTPAGRAFVTDAQQLLAAQAAAIRRAQRIDQGLQGQVDVGFHISVSYHHLPELLRRSAEALPGLTLRVQQKPAAELIDLVRRGRLDLALIRGPMGIPSDVAAVEVAVEGIVAVLPANHTHARRSSIRLSALRSDPFVLLSHTALPGFADKVRTACRDAGFSPHEIGYADEVSGLLGYTMAGRAVTLLAEQVGTLRHPGIVFIPLQDPSPLLMTTVIAIHRHRPDPAVQRLITLLDHIEPPTVSGRRPDAQC